MADTENLVNRKRTEPAGEEAAAPEPVLSEREAYCNALRVWIHRVEIYRHLSNWFPYYSMTFQGMHNNQSNLPLLNNNYQFQDQPFPFQVPPFVPRPAPVNPPPQDANVNPADVINRHGGFEYVIPPIHKRILAELIDFVLLFIVKIFVTLLAVDIFDIIDISKFDLQRLSENYEDYQFAIDLTTEVLYLEIIFRMFVCIIEAFYLSKNFVRAGGATPGKAIMGLRVVTATAVVQVEGRPKETVLLYPGTPLSFSTSLIRSLIKNLLISLVFPICIIFFVFRFNRTGYDLLCGVIVVEENMFPPRRNAP